MKRDKIVILIWDMGLGGVQRQVADIVTTISNTQPQHQIEIWIKNRRENFYPELKLLPRVKVIDLGGAKGRLHTLIDFAKITRQLISSNPTTLLTFHEYLSVFTIAIIKFLKVSGHTKVIIYEPNFTTLYMSFKKRSRLWNQLIKHMYPHADKIITTTKAAAADLHQQYAIASEKMIAIPTWTTQFPSQIPTKKKYDLLFLGRLETQKRPDLFVELIKRLHQNYGLETTGIICGDGLKRSQLQRKIKAHKLQNFITMTGSVLPTKTKDIICQAKVLILPSLFEGMPLVVIEAAACGVPAIVSDYPGVSEVIRNNETGFVSKNLDNMVRLAHQLLADNNLLKQTGVKAIRYVNGNHAHSNIQEFVNILI
jgi:glycosyltransferase involved in cell wall biosynthesis